MKGQAMKGQEGAMKSQGKGQREMIDQVGQRADSELHTEAGAARSGADRCTPLVP